MVHKQKTIENNKNKKCYKKHCNRIITRKQLNKYLIKQFNNLSKKKNTITNKKNITNKRKLTKLIIKSDNCMKKYCKL